MWATGRVLFGLSDTEFWELTPDEWINLHRAHVDKLRVYDAFQARVSSVVAMSGMSKAENVEEEKFRLFPTKKRKKNLLDKWLTIVNLFSQKKRGETDD